MRVSGTLLCLGSAAAFGAMAILAKLAYENGANVGTLLSIRFLMAAAIFWALVPAAQLKALARRDVAQALGMGAAVYAAQAGTYFAALQRIDASLASLLTYTFPAIVAVAAVALGRERMDAPKLVALALAAGGLVLVLAGAGTGALDPLGTALALVTAVLYSVYVLVGQGVAARVPARVLAALVCSGAAGTLTIVSAILGELQPGRLSVTAWASIAGITVVSTVVALSLLFAGLRRVGPTTASILATGEPVVTVLLAFLVFGESLRPTQLAGGALVVAAVLVLALSGGAPRRIGRWSGARRGVAGTAQERAPDAGEGGGERVEQPAGGIRGARLDEHGLHLGDRTRAGLMAPGDVQVLAADDLGQVRGEDDIGVRVIDRQV